MTGDPEVTARVTLARISEPADARLAIRIAEVGAAEAVREIASGRSPLAHAESLRVRLRSYDVDGDLEATNACGARIVAPGDPSWPTQLDDLGPRAPLVLWCSGPADLRLLALRSIAVVGARAATAYGETVARRLAADLAGGGWCVVSGGAFGIDAAAHRGALAAGGATICVLPGGIDVVYPRAHDSLVSSIRESGLLVSESPPGSAAMRQRFLTRNRLIAALTRATIVVEAALRSGSRNTAAAAAAVGRHVLAMPGPVTSTMSGGCHEMIRTGDAVLCTGASDVFELVSDAGAGLPGMRRGETLPLDVLSPEQRRVLDAVPARRPAPVDSIAVTAGLPPRSVLSALGILLASGLVCEVATGWRRQPA